MTFIYRNVIYIYIYLIVAAACHDCDLNGSGIISDDNIRQLYVICKIFIKFVFYIDYFFRIVYLIFKLLIYH